MADKSWEQVQIGIILPISSKEGERGSQAKRQSPAV